MKSITAIIGCQSYEPALLDRVIASAAELADCPDVRGASVLLKPNMLSSAAPERAVTTHPEFLRAVIRFLTSRGAGRVLVGDSPGWQSPEAAGRGSGLMQATLSEGALWADFGGTVEVPCPAGKIAKRFFFAKAFEEADLLFSLPKLKTHGLLRYTGAMKNLFGLLPGFAKSGQHLRFPSPEDFGSMIVDLNLAANPDFSIMDGVVAMEGAGPSNGKPRRLGVVFASRDPLALDWSAADFIGYDSAELAYLADAASRGVWIRGPGDIILAGDDPSSLKPSFFDRVKKTRPASSRLPRFLIELTRNLSAPRPFFSKRSCKLCGACVKICPPKVLGISKERGRVLIDRQKCIRCYCCDEVCPHGAIALRRLPF